MKQGEVWWVDFAMPIGRHPAVLLTRTLALPYMTQVSVAPITTTIRGLDSEVELNPDEDGVRDACVVSLDNVQTVSVRLLDDMLTELTSSRMAEVFEALHFAYDMPF